MKIFRTLCFTLLLALTACAEADQDISISNAWARATAPGQQVAAAYMSLLSKQGTSLIKAESDLATTVEIHSMTMENDVMKMRMLEALPLPAGTTVNLEPGGYHLMLFGLKQALKVGEEAEFKLYFKNRAGETNSMTVKLPVMAAGRHGH